MVLEGMTRARKSFPCSRLLAHESAYLGSKDDLSLSLENLVKPAVPAFRSGLLAIGGARHRQAWGEARETSLRGSAVHAIHLATFNPIVANHRLLKNSPGKQAYRI